MCHGLGAKNYRCHFLTVSKPEKLKVEVLFLRSIHFQVCRAPSYRISSLPMMASVPFMSAPPRDSVTPVRPGPPEDQGDMGGKVPIYKNRVKISFEAETESKRRKVF